MSLLATAGIGAAAGIGSGIASAVSGRKNVKRTINANKEASDLAWNRSLQAWHMENAYNTPTAQMQRYAEAGLNPHLIYGSGGSAGNASSVDSPPLPTYSDQSSQGAAIGSGIERSVASFNSIRLQNAQVDNVQAQNDLIRAQTDKTEAEALRSHSEYGVDFGENGLRRSEREAEVWTKQQKHISSTADAQIRHIERYITDSTKDEVIERVRQDLQNATRQGRNLDADYFYKLESTTAIKLENQLRRLGINPNDPTYLRILGRSLNRIFEVPQLKDYINRKSKSLFNYGR